MIRGDRVVIAVVALLAALAWPVSFLAAAGGVDSVVVTGPRGTTRLALDADASADVEGLDGTVRVLVEDGSVRVSDSSCPDQLCVGQGTFSRPGAAIVCAPNGVTVRVGGGDRGLDAVVR